MTSLPELKVTVYSDYICPFCYLGHHRLLRLRDNYDLKINWCFLEIHPEVSPQTEPIGSLDYPSEQWEEMLKNLQRIADEENIPLSKINFITNSRDALLLSEATKQCNREVFYKLHEKLFNAYFVDAINIGDRKELKTIARACGIDEAVIKTAWSDPQYRQRLTSTHFSARKQNIKSVPSFIFGDQILTGVVSEAAFRKAAEALVLKRPNNLP